MKTTDQIIKEQIGISLDADDLILMDKGECKLCMEAYAEEKNANLGVATSTALDKILAELYKNEASAGHEYVHFKREKLEQILSKYFV